MEAELKSLLNYLNEDAPPVRALKAQLEGTRATEASVRGFWKCYRAHMAI